MEKYSTIVPLNKTSQYFSKNSISSLWKTSFSTLSLIPPKANVYTPPDFQLKGNRFGIFFTKALLKGFLGTLVYKKIWHNLPCFFKLVEDLIIEDLWHQLSESITCTLPLYFPQLMTLSKYCLKLQMVLFQQAIIANKLSDLFFHIDNLF